MGRRGIVWKTPDITADGLKMFACIVMLIQSIGIVVVEKGLIHLDQYTQAGLNEAMAQDSHLMTLAGVGSVMQLIGGMAVPIFAFLLAEGFKHTEDYRKYLLIMGVTAVASEIPYDWAMSGKIVDVSGQNALVGTCICLMMLKCLDFLKNMTGFFGALLKTFVVFAAVIWVSLMRAEFGLCMVLLVAVFFLFDTKNIWKTVLGCVISLMYVTGPIAFYGIWCYNGKRNNRIPKYVYYAFYPLHLVVLEMLVKFL